MTKGIIVTDKRITPKFDGIFNKHFLLLLSLKDVSTGSFFLNKKDMTKKEMEIIISWCFSFLLSVIINCLKIFTLTMVDATIEFVKILVLSKQGLHIINSFSIGGYFLTKTKILVLSLL